MVEVAANEETKVDEIQQNAEESNSTETDGGVPEECSVTSKSHGDEECKSWTLDEAAKDRGYTNLAEKLGESRLGQVDGSDQLEHDEQLGEESERHPLTEASTEGTDDNVSEAIDEVKVVGIKESKLSENEQSTRCALVKEGTEIEHPAESELCQENNIKGSSEEQNTNTNLHGNTIQTEEATINEDEVVDQQKESLESFLPIVSSSPDEGSMNADLQEIRRDHMDDIVEEVDKHKEVLESHSITVSTEDAKENSLIKLESSENKNKDILGKESEEMPLPLPLVSDESKFIHENQFEDGDSKKAKLCDNDRTMLLERESRTENTEDLLHATSEDSIAPDLGEERETTSAMEEQNLSTHLQETQDKISEEGTVDTAEAKENSLENVPTHVSNEKTEDNSLIQVADQKVENEEHLEKEKLEVSLIKYNNMEEVVVKDDGNTQLFVKDRSTESILLTEEELSEKPSDSFEDVKTLDLEATGILHNQIPADNSQGIHSEQKEIDEKTQELQNISTDSEVTEASEEDLIADESTVPLKPKTADECLNEVEIPNDEKIADYPILEKENSQNAPEDHKTSTSSEGIETISSVEEQTLEENSQSFTSKNVATEISHEHIEDNSVSQVDCTVGVHEELLEKDSPIEETNVRESRNIDEPKNGSEDILKVKPEDIKHDSGPGISDKEEEEVEKHIEEEILTADTQECSPAEVDDGSQKPSSEEVLTEKINDDEPTAISEDKVANENTVIANPFKEEMSIECALVKEEVYVESLQVADEHTTSSVQDREESHIEEHAPTTDSQGTMDDQKDGKTPHLADPKEETLDYKKHATTPCEDGSEEPIQVDKITSSTDAPKDDGKDSNLVREVPEIECPVDSSLEASEEIIAFDSCQDTEICSTEKQIPDLEDISSNVITEETIEATGEEIKDPQDIAKSVPQEEDSPEVKDGSQKSSLLEGPKRNIDEHESKDELLKNEKEKEDTLINEDVPIELPHVAADDIKEPFSSEVKETDSQEEHILHANPAGLTDDNRTIDQIVFEKDTPADEVAKEIESADVKATPTELKEEESYLDDLQMTTTVNLVAAHQDKSSDLTSEKTRSAEDLDVNKDVIRYIPAVSNDKQQESSIAEVSEEHMTTSHDHDTSTESGVPEKNNDQVDEEANSCGDKTDSEKIEVLDDGSIAAPTDETLAESTVVEVQVSHGEKDAVLILQEAKIDQKHIKETLLSNASEDVSELEEANGEEKIDSNNCEEMSVVASQEVSTSNSSQEPRRETREETEEVHKQESELQVPELRQESSVEQIERDAQLCPSDSGIMEEVLPPTLEENIIETADCKESDVVESETNNEDIGQQEQNEKIDTKPTEEELEETVANDLVQVSLRGREPANQEEPCTVKTATEDDEEIKIDEGVNDEKEAYEENIANISSNIIDTTVGPMANEKTSAECILVNERSVTDLETRNDDEALQTKETTPLSAVGQDVEEHSNYPGSLIGEKLDSNEAAFASGENKSAYKSNNEVLESITKVQNCDIISEKEETQIGEENLKAEIISDKAVGEDIFQQEETGCEKEILKGDILSEKEQLLRIKAEDEDIKDQGSCEEVITEGHRDNEAKQEQKNNNEAVEYIKDGNEAEKVPEVYEEANDKVPQDLEDEVKQEQQENSTETVEFIKDGNETEKASEVSEESSDKVPQDLEEKILTNEGIDGFLDQEEPPKSIEEPMDTGKARELDIASVTDTSDSIKEGVQIAIIPGEESDEHNDKDEILNFDEAQPKEVEQVNDKCKELTDTSIQVELPVISSPKLIPECTPLEAEDPQIKLHDNISDSEVKIAEKDDAVNLHNLRDISEDIQEPFFEVSNHDNTLERDPEEQIETSERPETKPIENAPVSETEEQKLGSGTEDVHEEEKKINCIPHLLESSSGPETEKVPESGIYQSSVEDTAPPFIQQATSDVKKSENDVFACVAGLDSLDVKEPEASPLPSKDKHVVLEADDKKNSDPENLGGKKNLSAEYLQGEYELVKPSKVKQEEAECESDGKTDEKREGKPENEEAHAENSDEALHENSKTDDEEESHEQKMPDLVSEAPVMVDMGDADVKVAHKKSHNILSGVGSKVKHSIAKVKKAITGKSSHPKTPSPKKVTIEKLNE